MKSGDDKKRARPFFRASPSQKKGLALFSAGFTLIEMLLVAALMTILAAVATPRFRATFEQVRFDQRAQDLAQLIRAGHELAIVKANHVRIVMDEEAGVVQLQEPFLDEDGQQRFRPLAGRWGRRWQAAQPSTLETSGTAIDCFPDGRTTPALIRILHPRVGEHRISVGAFGGALALD